MTNPNPHEMHDLVRAMYRRFTPAEIGESLGGFSAQAIRDVLLKLGLTERRRPFAERIANLEPALRNRITNFATQRRQTQTHAQHA